MIIILLLFYKEWKYSSSLLSTPRLSGPSLFLEIFIVIPLLFFYCDWFLCQDIADKRRYLQRFNAILDKLK